MNAFCGADRSIGWGTGSKLISFDNRIAFRAGEPLHMLYIFLYFPIVLPINHSFPA
ncbi:hypothetical protein BX070DRAFT_218504, partial [Coemansia spiralis]